MGSNGINIIVAASTNLVIGSNNDLPWDIPLDLKKFKEITNGHTVIMGRKCWESIPSKFRPLPNRFNIVLTRNKEYDAKGAIILHDLSDAIKFSKKHTNGKIFIIGGSEIYKTSFDLVDTVYLTLIYSDIEGDTYLDGFKKEEWSLVDSSDELYENGFKFKFLKYERHL